MNVVQEFNALDGKTVKKRDLLRLKKRAVNQLQQEVVDRINTLLLNYPSTILGDRGITISVTKKAKWVPTGTGLGAARHTGVAKEALSECGRLNPGYYFAKGGDIVKSKKPPKRKIRKGKFIPGYGKVNDFQFENGFWQYYVGGKSPKSGQLVAESILLDALGNSKINPDPTPKIKDTGHKRKMRRIKKDPAFEQGQLSLGLGITPGEAFMLPGLEELPTDYQCVGLGKAVQPNDIYQYVTDLVITTIHKEGLLPWQKSWKATTLWNGTEAVNFVTKRPYRGINYFLLNFESKKGKDGKYWLAPKIWKNPYFLTFNQIEKYGGKLKEGSDGYRVVYFTKLYGHREGKGKDKLEFYSYDQKKYLAWIKKNKDRLQILKITGWTVERLSRTYIPILRYYNVYNGGDVTDIDFGKIPKNPNTDKPESERIEVAESIVTGYPKPPKIHFRGDRAFYQPGTDTVVNPPISSFKNPQSFYSTLFHELIHSTGHKSRLKRDFSGRFGTKSYAKEELVAEMGAVFLCAESGILFETLNNSAAYLKGWNSKLVGFMQKDNRYFFRAASAAQEAADHILQPDTKGVPKYRKSVQKKQKSVQLGLFGSSQITVSSEHFKKMKVSELRQFTLDYYNKFLRGKKVLVEKSLHCIEFVGPAGRKIAKGGAMYKEKAAIIERFEEIVKNSTYNNWGAPKKGDPKDVLGYLNFKSKLIIDGQKRHVRIAVVVYKSRKTLLKNYEVGKSKTGHSSQGSRRFPCGGEEKPVSKSKNTKKGLSNPEPLANGNAPLPPKPAGDAVGGTPPAQVLDTPAVPLDLGIPPEASPKTSIPDPDKPKLNIGRKMSDVGRTNKISFTPMGPIGEFLGNIERKPKGSVVITLDAEAGAGKTRYFFQAINAYANAGYDTAFFSLEEHPDSDVFTQKRDQYLNQKAQSTVLVLGDDEIDRDIIKKVFQAYDIIFTDSFGKLQSLLGRLSLDEDIRKKYDGKLFFFIYQRTADGKMRGGADSAFDADIVSKVEKDPTGGRDHLVYFVKNRYEKIPGLKYNVNTQSVVFPESEEIEEEEQEPTSKIVVSV